MTEIPALVAAILNEREVAINAGSEAGVEEGDRAAIMRTVTIRDPETAEELGKVDVHVLAVYITSVQPRLSVAAVAEMQEPAGEIVSTLFTRSRPKRIVESSGQAKAGISVVVRTGWPVVISKKPRKASEEQ